MSYYIVRESNGDIVGFYTGEEPVGVIVEEVDRETYLRELLAYNKGDKR